MKYPPVHEHRESETKGFNGWGGYCIDQAADNDRRQPNPNKVIFLLVVFDPLISMLNL